MNDLGHVSVHVLSAGYLTLTEPFVVAPVDDKSARITVPSMSFLIQHTDAVSSHTTRLVFDLGVCGTDKRLRRFEPASGHPDTVSSLARGDLKPEDIDYIVLSHLHFDHVGVPSKYPSSTYIIGPSASRFIDENQTVRSGGVDNLKVTEIDTARTVELHSTDSPTHSSRNPDFSLSTDEPFKGPWQRKGPFDNAMDVFRDGSLFVINAPGHSAGHINLLCRLESGRYVYLAGDACHDTRILDGTKEIATWKDAEDPNIIHCMHDDKGLAEKTLTSIRDTKSGISDLGDVEVVLAHDTAWHEQAQVSRRYLPGAL